MSRRDPDWTPTEWQQALAMRDAGMRYRDISVALGRNPRAMERRVSNLARTAKTHKGAWEEQVREASRRFGAAGGLIMSPPG